jgi:hypothetical protein
MSYDKKLADAEARIDALEAALAPFALHLDEIDPQASDGLEVSGSLCVAHIRRAAAVMAEN